MFLDNVLMYPAKRMVKVPVEDEQRDSYEVLCHRV
jgi:hypothetical protein